MRRVALALLALITLGGCGDGEVLELSSNYVQLRVRDYRYDHQDVQVPAGRTLFGVANDGPEPTNFRVRRGGTDVLDITTMQPGERGVGYVTLKPGRYVMYSSVGRNETLGEYGSLTVTRSPASRRPSPRAGTRQAPRRP